MSVQKAVWGGLANGALLKAAEQQFDVLITGDRNLAFQQNISKHCIAVVILHAENTQLHFSLALVPKILAVLKAIEAGEVLDVYP